MGWESAFQKTAMAAAAPLARPIITPLVIDWKKLVVIDFETYFDQDYTLRKMSTSEYIRDERFMTHMMGIKVGTRKRIVVRGKDVPAALSKIDWTSHTLLCHNTAFDGFILSHHYKVKPKFYFDTLSMARGLHSNDIGASLDEVAKFYGVGNKIQDVLGTSKGLVKLPPAIYRPMAEYCGVDVDLTLDIFRAMCTQVPASEMELIHRTLTMFCQPVLKVDMPRVAAEHKREVDHKEALLLSFLGDENEQLAQVLTQGRAGAIESARKRIAGQASYVDLLQQALGPSTPVPTKLSPTTGRATYAFAKTDVEFVGLLEHPSARVRELVECRLAVKSTIDETRAKRFMTAGANGMSLPVLLHYYGAHTGRWSAGNKMNLQNLKRGGELRRSILAPKGQVIVVGDSGQIEARTNAWLAGQEDLLDDFRASDAGTDRDPYCKFGDVIYGYSITKSDKVERFVGKVCVLGLGYQMGAAKLQGTLASGAMGQVVFLDFEKCQTIINAYRRRNDRIVAFWRFANNTILEDMHAGRTGEYKCLQWEKERIWLPNGMCLKYPGLRMVSDPDSTYSEWSYLRKGNRVKIYGGLLTENIVQALSRIIIGEQMLRVKERIVMSTHDEIAHLARAAGGKKALAVLIANMSIPPVWAPDLPLIAEGSFDTFYSK